MKKKFRRDITIALLINIFCLNLFTVNAESNNNDKEIVMTDKILESAEEMTNNYQYTQEQVELANRKPIITDKGSTKEVTTYSIARSRFVIKGNYPRRKGIILVTPDPYKDLIPTGHAAIVFDEGHVIEALGNGVLKKKNNWTEHKNTVYGVTVGCTSIGEDERAADWCYSQLYKPYNFNYLDKNTRNAFYCSHLVWASFKDTCGIDLDTVAYTNLAVHPMELVNTPLTSVVYYYGYK